jgi:peptidyl-prolyl cis-trans isomerase B (cyclophilin B)
MKNLSNQYILLALLIISYTSSQQGEKEVEQPMTKIKMITTMGKITIQLYNEIPLYRYNIIRIVEQGGYDSIVLHRAIKDFIIQGGDMPARISLKEQLEIRRKNPRVSAEFDTSLFLKRRTIGAPCNDNPLRTSSGTSFFINIGTSSVNSVMN